MTLPALPLRKKRVGDYLGTSAAKTLATDELGSIRRTQALLKLALELFDLRMGFRQGLSAPHEYLCSRVVVKGAGGQIV